MRSDGVVAGEVAVNRWDLGSIPRSPQNFYIVFLYLIICRLSSDVHHALQAIRRHVALCTDLMATREGPPYS